MTAADPPTGAPALEILPDLYFVERGFLSGNHFVLRAEEPVLVDTAYASEVPKTLAAIEALGADWRRTRLIVSTHGHCDHVGANRAIQTASGCAVAMHPVGRHFIETRNAWATWWSYYAQEAEFFECTRSLGDGERVEVGPYPFEVLHAPGHSADGLALYQREAGVLFSSDVLWPTDMPVATERVEGSATLFRWIESLDRLGRLDAAAVYPGHGRPFHDLAGTAAKARERIGRYLRRPGDLGRDLLKRITVYTLLMRGPRPPEVFRAEVAASRWFRETVDLYLDGAYAAELDRALGDLLRRGVVFERGGCFETAVPP